MSVQKFLPLVVLVAVLLLCFIGLRLDPRSIPSPLLGQPLPQSQLPLLDNPGQSISTASLASGKPVLLNVFASWCVACVHEHPLLMEIAAVSQVPLYGLNYKDGNTEAQDWLRARGNPYSQVLVDGSGSFGRSIGVYGVPETFVLDAGGIIVYKHIGPLTRTVWLEKISPLLGIGQ